MLGLQEDYRLLAALEDELATRFSQLGLDDRQRSPLAARNQSILAHGFQPVAADVFSRLKQAALKLAEIDEGTLPVFPKLGA